MKAPIFLQRLESLGQRSKDWTATSIWRAPRVSGYIFKTSFLVYILLNILLEIASCHIVYSFNIITCILQIGSFSLIVYNSQDTEKHKAESKTHPCSYFYSLQIITFIFSCIFFRSLLYVYKYTNLNRYKFYLTVCLGVSHRIKEVEEEKWMDYWFTVLCFHADLQSSPHSPGYLDFLGRASTSWLSIPYLSINHGNPWLDKIGLRNFINIFSNIYFSRHS